MLRILIPKWCLNTRKILNGTGIVAYGARALTQGLTPESIMKGYWIMLDDLYYFLILFCLAPPRKVLLF